MACWRKLINHTFYHLGQQCEDSFVTAGQNSEKTWLSFQWALERHPDASLIFHQDGDTLVDWHQALPRFLMRILPDSSLAPEPQELQNLSCTKSSKLQVLLKPNAFLFIIVIVYSSFQLFSAPKVLAAGTFVRASTNTFVGWMSRGC